jgi:hypothetical protein
MLAAAVAVRLLCGRPCSASGCGNGSDGGDGNSAFAGWTWASSLIREFHFPIFDGIASMDFVSGAFLT